MSEATLSLRRTQTGSAPVQEEPGTISPVQRALASALWDEPENIPTLVQKVQRYRAAEGIAVSEKGMTHTIKQALADLMDEGIVNSRSGLFFLTPEGRCWATDIIGMDVEENYSRPKVSRFRVPCNNVVFWGNPAYLESLQ